MKVHIKRSFAAVLLLFFFRGPEFAAADDPVPVLLHRAVFTVNAVRCTSCFHAITARLSGMNGFSGMGINLFRKKAAVDFTGPLTPQQIQQAIVGLGFPAGLVSVSPVAKEKSFAHLTARQAPSPGCYRCL